MPRPRRALRSSVSASPGSAVDFTPARVDQVVHRPAMGPVSIVTRLADPQPLVNINLVHAHAFSPRDSGGSAAPLPPVLESELGPRRSSPRVSAAQLAVLLPAGDCSRNHQPDPGGNAGATTTARKSIQYLNLLRPLPKPAAKPPKQARIETRVPVTSGMSSGARSARVGRVGRIHWPVPPLECIPFPIGGAKYFLLTGTLEYV